MTNPFNIVLDEGSAVHMGDGVFAIQRDGEPEVSIVSERDCRALLAYLDGAGSAAVA